MEIRGNPDIEINSNVHHAKRRNTETVSNRARFPWTGFLFVHVVLFRTYFYITPLFKLRPVRSVLRCMREYPNLSQMDRDLR